MNLSNHILFPISTAFFRPWITEKLDKHSCCFQLQIIIPVRRSQLHTVYVTHYDRLFPKSTSMATFIRLSINLSVFISLVPTVPEYCDVYWPVPKRKKLFSLGNTLGWFFEFIDMPVVRFLEWLNSIIYFLAGPYTNLSDQLLSLNLMWIIDAINSSLFGLKIQFRKLKV